MIQFPAVFKLSDQDELLYIADQNGFTTQYQLQRPYLTPDDLLIDSEGKAYLLHQLSLENSLPRLFKKFTLQELTALVQAHFFANAQTCVTKIHAADINTLFSLLQHSD